jgi:RNA polymerase sigma-70 factor (ECF subfamily)
MDDATDREDLFQEITLQAWKSFNNFKGEAKFSTWLYRVALNTAITYFKKEQRNTALQSLQQIHNHNESKDIIEEQAVAMYKAIGNLSRIDKALVMLYLDDYSYDEISSVLGITANHVAVKMNRVKTRLKEETKKFYEHS